MGFELDYYDECTHLWRVFLLNQKNRFHCVKLVRSEQFSIFH